MPENVRAWHYMVRGYSMTEQTSKQSDQVLFDVMVIGAGINGAGIARDAAMRGLKVLLLDKGDVGSGTSSWSTRLIHGGLRYLEHGEVGLVRESLRERETLLYIAPHLVRPLPILFPIYKHARRGRWTILAGMAAYDLLSFDKSLPRHRMLSRVEALDQAPGLEPQGLVGAAIYFDAQVEFAERLVLENVLAAVDYGATVVTYAQVENFIVERGLVQAVEFTRVLDGESCSASADVIINAAGPWVDELLDKSGGNPQRLIGGTKGSHVIVAAFSGAPATALYVEGRTDGRPFFIIPWNGQYLIGTTDIRYQGDLDHVRIENQEIDYLLDETNRLIPTAKLSRGQVLYAYSGVRPLAFTCDKDEQSITRRHFIREHPSRHNLLSIVGGKLTTYRKLAEQAVDQIFRKLERRSPRCTTAQVPLPGAATNDFARFCKEFNVASGLPSPVNDRWLRIFGTRSSELLNLIADAPSLAEVFDVETGATAVELVFAFQHELAQTLADCLLRRTMVGLNSANGLNAVSAAARIARKHLGWSDGLLDEQLADYRNQVAQFRLTD
ncbi:MAG: glycerol-3-phosphate dehydrogenase [bacterium]